MMKKRVKGKKRVKRKVRERERRKWEKMIPDKNGDGNNYTKSHSKCKINIHHPRDNTKGLQQGIQNFRHSPL
jgi:hypothetical protein